MARQIQFSRPVEYDPSLASASSASNGAQSKAEVLANEFGFEADSDDDGTGAAGEASEGSDAEHGDMNGRSKAPNITKQKSTYARSNAAAEEAAAELEAQHAEELDRLAQALAEAQDRAARSEDLAARTEERLEELSAMSKQAKNILVAKFRQQLKVLMAQLEEQKVMLAEDDETLEALKAANLKLEAGDAAGAAEAQARLKEFKDSRVLSRENTALKYKVEEVNAALKAAQTEAAEAAARAEAAEAKAKSAGPANATAAGASSTVAAAASAGAAAAGGASSEEVAALKTRVEQLESERIMFREDIKKRHIERTKLVAKLTKLTGAATPEAIAAELAKPDAQTVPAAAAAVAAAAPAAATTPPAAGGLSAEEAATVTANAAAAANAHAIEKGKYQAKIKQMEASLLAAQKATAEAQKSAAEANAAAAAAANKPAPAPVAAVPAGASAAEVEAAAAAAAASAAAAATASATAAASASAATAAAAAAARESELTEAIQKLDELLKRREGELNEVKEKAKEKLTTASNAIKKLKTEYGTLRAAYTKLKEDGVQTAADKQARADQSARLARRKEILAGMKKICAGSKSSLDKIKSDLFVMNSEIPALGPAISSAVQTFIASRASESQHILTALKKEMALRRQLFNQIQELKGNIRVYCRVRPMNARELADPNNQLVISHPAAGEMAIQNFEKKTSHTFEFEQIFDSSKKQAEIFAEVSDLVVSVLDGYNVCIFAYGQTGSGKTYTMQGPKEDPGVNTRALARLFEVAQERFPDVKYEIKITLLEIYNEKIQDLLGEKGRVLKAVQGQYGMEVQDLTMVSVANEAEVLDTLKRGSKNRSVVATNMNDVSSRSHLILSVYVMARNSITGKDTMGKLHLIDLAGSERVGRSGVVGDAMKEAQAINQSLSALGNVISARANKSAHVPYRDSTLTYLLQDSLEKNSKTLMFVQVSPVKADSSESICSLRFAERVRKVELGKAEAVKKK